MNAVRFAPTLARSGHGDLERERQALMVTGLSHDVTDEDMHAVFTPICGAVHVQLLPPREPDAPPTALVWPNRSHAHAYDNAILKGLNANGIVVRGRRIGVCGTFSGQGSYGDATHNPGSPGYPHAPMQGKAGSRKPRHRWLRKHGHDHANAPLGPNRMGGRYGLGHPHLVPGYGGPVAPGAMAHPGVMHQSPLAYAMPGTHSPHQHGYRHHMMMHGYSPDGHHGSAPVPHDAAMGMPVPPPPPSQPPQQPPHGAMASSPPLSAAETCAAILRKGAGGSVPAQHVAAPAPVPPRDIPAVSPHATLGDDDDLDDEGAAGKTAPSIPSVRAVRGSEHESDAAGGPISPLSPLSPRSPKECQATAKQQEVAKTLHNLGSLRRLVLVQNIAVNVQADDIKKLLVRESRVSQRKGLKRKPYAVENVVVHRSKPGWPKGFAYITLKKDVGLQKACAVIDGTVLMSQKLTAQITTMFNPSVPKNKDSATSEGGQSGAAREARAPPQVSSPANGDVHDSPGVVAPSVDARELSGSAAVLYQAASSSAMRQHPHADTQQSKGMQAVLVPHVHAPVSGATRIDPNASPMLHSNSPPFQPMHTPPFGPMGVSPVFGPAGVPIDVPTIYSKMGSGAAPMAHNDDLGSMNAQQGMSPWHEQQQQRGVVDIIHQWNSQKSKKQIRKARRREERENRRLKRRFQRAFKKAARHAAHVAACRIRETGRSGGVPSSGFSCLRRDSDGVASTAEYEAELRKCAQGSAKLRNLGFTWRRAVTLVTEMQSAGVPRSAACYELAITACERAKMWTAVSKLVTQMRQDATTRPTALVVNTGAAKEQSGSTGNELDPWGSRAWTSGAGVANSVQPAASFAAASGLGTSHFGNFGTSIAAEPESPNRLIAGAISSLAIWGGSGNSWVVPKDAGTRAKSSPLRDSPPTSRCTPPLSPRCSTGMRHLLSPKVRSASRASSARNSRNNSRSSSPQVGPQQVPAMLPHVDEAQLSLSDVGKRDFQQDANCTPPRHRFESPTTPLSPLDQWGTMQLAEAAALSALPDSPVHMSRRLSPSKLRGACSESHDEATSVRSETGELGHAQIPSPRRSGEFAQDEDSSPSLEAGIAAAPTVQSTSEVGEADQMATSGPNAAKIDDGVENSSIATNARHSASPVQHVDVPAVLIALEVAQCMEDSTAVVALQLGLQKAGVVVNGSRRTWVRYTMDVHTGVRLVQSRGVCPTHATVHQTWRSVIERQAKSQHNSDEEIDQQEVSFEDTSGETDEDLSTDDEPSDAASDDEDETDDDNIDDDDAQGGGCSDNVDDESQVCTGRVSKIMDHGDTLEGVGGFISFRFPGSDDKSHALFQWSDLVDGLRPEQVASLELTGSAPAVHQLRRFITVGAEVRFLVKSKSRLLQKIAGVTLPQAQNIVLVDSSFPKQELPPESTPGIPAPAAAAPAADGATTVGDSAASTAPAARHSRLARQHAALTGNESSLLNFAL